MDKNKLNSGIYKIEHTESGRFYIGSAVNIKQRWAQHRSNLKAGKHPNRKLQGAWSKYGEENFKFLLLLSCEKKDLLVYEQISIDAYDTVKTGFNIRPKAESQIGFKHSEETKKRISEKNTGKNNPMYGSTRTFTEETIEKIRESSLGEQNGMYGKSHSEEARKKIGEANSGNKHTEDVKKLMSLQRSGGNNAMFGKTHSEEARKKMSERAKNRVSPRKGIPGKPHSEETRRKIAESTKLAKSKKF